MTADGGLADGGLADGGPADPGRSSRSDVRAALAAVALVAVAALVGAVGYALGRPVHASTAPLFAKWSPHVGPGTPLALALAALIAWWGPALAARWSWARLLTVGYVGTVLWILALSLVDGWQRGVVNRLTTRDEYLSEVAGVTDVPAMLRGFAARIVDFQPDSWTTHVSGHPPGALLVFVALDRVGLGSGGWAGLACILVGASLTVSVATTLRAVAADQAARAAVPFLVLFPGAVWTGVSADGLFAGVTAAGVALLAVGLTRRSRSAAVAGACAGLLLGYGLFLSYGLTLMAVLVLAVGLLARRGSPRGWAAGLTWLAAVVGAGAVVLGFRWAGFWWLDGYHLVVVRYYQGVASDRPYAYWVWANLAAVVFSAGPAAAAVLRRAATVAAASVRAATAPVRAASTRWRMPLPGAAALLPLAAAVAMLAADLSGLSKAEVERIWLPFAVWLCAGAALLPGRSVRAWLAVQAGTALLVNHLLLTAW